jgi:hypothetical protein
MRKQNIRFCLILCVTITTAAQAQELQACPGKDQGFKVTEDGITPVGSVAGNGQAKIALEAIQSGRVFLLRPAS